MGKKKSCGFDHCTMEITVNGEPEEKQFCHYDEQSWKCVSIYEVIELEQTARLWINGRSIADLRVVYSETDHPIVRVTGNVNIPGNSLCMECKENKEGTVVRLVSDGPLCRGMVNDSLTLILSVPRNYTFDSLYLTGKTIACDIPLVAYKNAVLSALNDIRFSMRSLNLKVDADCGNIKGTIVGQNSSYASISTRRGNIDITLQGYDVCNALISPQSTNMGFETLDETKEDPVILIGRIHTGAGSIIVR